MDIYQLVFQLVFPFILLDDLFIYLLIHKYCLIFLFNYHY